MLRAQYEVTVLDTGEPDDLWNQTQLPILMTTSIAVPVITVVHSGVCVA